MQEAYFYLIKFFKNDIIILILNNSICQIQFQNIKFNHATIVITSTSDIKCKN